MRKVLRIEDVECAFMQDIVCPYCGRVFSDCQEYHDCNTVDCDECENTFDLEIDYTVDYTTKRNCTLNGKTHEWTIDQRYNHCLGRKFVDNANDKRVYAMCMNCGKMAYIIMEK